MREQGRRGDLQERVCLAEKPPSARAACAAQELAPSPSSPHHLAGDELATQRGRAVRRWQWAIRAVVTSRAMAQDADVLNDRLAPAADRLHALVDLEWRLSAFPGSSRRQLAGALLRRREQRPTSLKDQLLNECFVTGARWGWGARGHVWMVVWGNRWSFLLARCSG